LPGGIGSSFSTVIAVTGLAAARLADDADGLAAVDRQVDAVDRVQPAVVGLEVGLQALDLQQRHCRRRLCAARPTATAT
jgi:hypothetical protein